MSDAPITYSCGCVNAIDPASGVLRSLSKCREHLRERHETTQSGRRYYTDLGAIIDFTPQCRRYIEQLLEPLREIHAKPPPAPVWSHSIALEIGGGASMYAPLLLRLGYRYLGVEPCHWAAEFTRTAFDVEVTEAKFEDAGDLPSCDLILSAHALEHFADAPAAVRRMFDLLRPGGRLLLIVPDDTDPVNPDHLWFFSESSLRKLLEASGFADVATTMRRHIARENFIYCAARKPELEP